SSSRRSAQGPESSSSISIGTAGSGSNAGDGASAARTSRGGAVGGTREGGRVARGGWAGGSSRTPRLGEASSSNSGAVPREGSGAEIDGTPDPKSRPRNSSHRKD